MSKNWIIGLALFAAACSGSAEVSLSSEQPDPAVPETEAVVGTNDEPATVTDEMSADTDDLAETEAVAETNDEPAAAAVPDIADEPGLPAANGVEIEQLTPKTGGGARPVLAWAPSDGADSYTVVVYDAEGAPWWSWAGSDTGIVIGGVETDVEIGGPRADVGVRWTVMAFDADGTLVGSSAKRSIEP